MTPKRVTEIGDALYRELCGPERYKSDESAIDRAITIAVNEALSESLKPAMSEAIFWSDCNDTRAYAACELIIGAIDAMKLPEEA